MENASKALLIAGAILIAIVLITFGVIILGQGSEIINNSSMSETEIATFNAKFTTFEGSIRGSKVNSLLNTVLQNNLSQDTSKQVAVGTGDSITNKGTVWLESSAKEIGEKALSGTVYTVTCKYNQTTGLVNFIQVTPGP